MLRGFSWVLVGVLWGSQVLAGNLQGFLWDDHGASKTPERPLQKALLKRIGPSHGPVPWQCVEKLLFNKGLISDLVLLGKADKQALFPEKMSFSFTDIFKGLPRILATIVNGPNVQTLRGFRIIWNMLATIASNQGSTLYYSQRLTDRIFKFKKLFFCLN